MIKILTSGFTNGFTVAFGTLIKQYIPSGMKFVFVASEFQNIHERTDWYCSYFLKMFFDYGITFSNVAVIDSRMSKDIAKETIRTADVLWLAGGDTPTQYSYLEAYELIPYIREHKGVIIGMSAGLINMAKTAVCTLTCKHSELKIYEALGLVDFSVEPHMNKDNISKELLDLSETYPLYGLCDDSAIVCTDHTISYLGDIFLIDNRHVTQLK